MTNYLVAKRQKLLDKFEWLEDVEGNEVAFHGIAALIQWIDDHPTAADQHYKAFEGRVKAAAEGYETSIDLVFMPARWLN